VFSNNAILIDPTLKLTSNTLISNLNSQLLNGYDSEFFRNANNINNGIVSPNHLGEGAANSNVFLTGDSKWKSVGVTNIGTGTPTSNTVLFGDGQWKAISSGAIGSGTPTSSTVLFGDGQWKNIQDYTVLKSGHVKYENRGDLRTLQASEGDLILVEQLGLFRFFEGGNYVDDDIKHFVSTIYNGTWVMECPSTTIVDELSESVKKIKIMALLGL
jgi:hypothetical protein